MDQCRSRLKLSENFECHWSIPFPGEIHMDQSLVLTFSWGNSYGPMVLKVFSKVSPYTGIGPWMALPSDSGTEPEPGTGTVGTVFPETESGTGAAGTVSRNRNWNRNGPFLLNS